MRPDASPDRTDTVPSEIIVSLPGSGSTATFQMPASLTSFIGREREVEQIAGRLRRSENRLLTLTGPGGVGKTRLALRVAETLATEFDRGVLFVPLATIDNPSLVAAEIGRAFGLSDSGDQLLADRIALVLAGQSLLLVLDNFERLVEAAPLLINLLSTCPSLTILTTSRIVLHISGEREFRVDPLDLPSLESSADQIAVSDAVRLFLERCHLPPCDPLDDQAIVVAAICRRLDGLPLAIELAAAKTRVLSLPNLLDRLDQRLPLLDDGPRDAPPRLKSMRDAIAWSYDLLSVDEQSLFRALSVFDGGFTVDAAEAIAPSSLNTPTVQALTSLIDHSLVHRVDTGTAAFRFTMLETIREFGIESLIAHGEEEDVRERHLDWFIEQLGSPTPEHWLESRASPGFALPNEPDNLRSALNWAIEHGQPERAAQVASGLLLYWWQNGLNVEALSTLERIQRHSESFEPILAAGVMLRLGGTADLLGDYAKSRDVLSAALRLCREIEYQPGIQTGLHKLAILTMFSDGPMAVDQLTEALEISRALGDDHLVATDLGQRALAHMLTGKLGLARQDLNQAIPMFRDLPRSQFGLALSLATMGWIAGLEGEVAEAERLGFEAFAISEAYNLPVSRIFSLRVLGETAFAHENYQLAIDRFQTGLHVTHKSSLRGLEGFVLAEVAMVAQSQGDWNRAAHLCGAAEASWNRLQFSESARANFGTWGNNSIPTPEVLSDGQFAAAYAVGQSFSLIEAYAEAMALTVAPRPRMVDAPGLSPRAIEVLGLVAHGLTNREIATALFVSPRTIDSHIVSILSKLGVNSRREAVAVARDRGLLGSSEVSSSRTAIHS